MKRLDTVTLKQLRALQAVAETGSISVAASNLSLTPPAVHNQIKQLETSFGCRMLRREGAEGFTPTPEGEVLLRAQHKLRASLETAVHEIDSLGKGLSGIVVLGVVSTGKYFAPRLVALLRSALPDVEVILKIGNRSEILAALTAGELHLAIMGRPPRLPEVHANVIGEHPHLMVAPPDHPLIHGPREVKDILSQTFVMRESGSGTRILTMRFLDDLGQGLDFARIEMDSNETIKQAVIAGLGVAILSGHTVFDELKSRRLLAVPVPGLPITRHWFVVYPAGADLTQTAVSVLTWLKNNAGNHLPDIGALALPEA